VATARPFTVPHFRSWCSGLVLDNDQPWRLEPFQASFAKDVFSGFLENWLVIPEGNAKTTFAGGLVLYHAQFRRGARIPVAASSREQAEWLYQAAAGFVERSPGIEKLFRCQEGYRRIRCDSMGSRVQIFAADDRTGDGVIPTLCVLEELHRHRDLSLYRTWRGKLEKRGGQLIAISTAGEPEGEFEAVRKRIRDDASTSERKGAFLRAASQTTVLHEYAVGDDQDPNDLRVVKRANPLKMITIPQLKRKQSSPSMVPSHWRRFVCGMPARMDEWIAPAAWDGLKVDVGGLRDGERVILGLRVGSGAGIGIVAPRDDERVAVGVRYLPATDGGRVAFHRIEDALLELGERYDVLEVDYDPKFSAGEILTEHLPMVGVPQSPSRLAVATATFWRLVSAGLMMHDGDPELRRQVLAGRTKETLEGWRLDPTPDTAGLVALAMACHEASKNIAPPPLVVLPSEVA
jgi:phage terminase large subunit-like protein